MIRVHAKRNFTVSDSPRLETALACFHSPDTAQPSAPEEPSARSRIAVLRQECADLSLENRTVLSRYSDEELAVIYNGIGPASFPDWLRDGITRLHSTLEPVALIHDVEWHETDGTKESFDFSNKRFAKNGERAAKEKFPWYNPRRYTVIRQAKRFAFLCSSFGWSSWKNPCNCKICARKESQE